MLNPFLAALAISLASGAAGATQEKPAPEKPPAAAPSRPAGQQVPLRVQLVLSRLQGEKKISSIPYMLGVLSNAQKTSLRMGIQVPVVSTVFGAAKEGGFATIPQASYNYRDVGTNIDCQAMDAGNGAYSLVITVADSSVHLDRPSSMADQKAVPPNVPVFRSFNASFAMLLRDGQTMQYASAVDPVSGEVMKIDVTLTLAK